MLVRDMGVHLSSGNTAMTQHALDAADICTIHKKISGKAMSHRVGADVFRNTGESCVFADHALDTASAETAVVACRRGYIVSAVTKKERGKVVHPSREVLIDVSGR